MFVGAWMASLIAFPMITIAQEAPFKGERLVALSDGAMLASGYIDGHLGSRRPDFLSVLQIQKDGSVNRKDIAVSNSVATWPNVMSLTSDGNIAIVTEPFAQPTKEATKFSEIKRGSQITLVDISNPKSPLVIQKIKAPGTPSAIDIHPSGTLVAVTLPFEGQIALYPLEKGRLGEPKVQSLGIKTIKNTYVPEFKWHPSGKFAAVTLGGAARVIFYRLEDDVLKVWGEPLQTAPLPGKGQWTSDGRFFIVTTITATTDMAQLSYGSNASLFAVFAFDGDIVENSPPRRKNDRKSAYKSMPIQHSRVAHIPGGIGYVENFAISPDSRWVVGLNMAASWLPKGHPGRTTYSELTLFSLDINTGIMKPHSSVTMDDVILPQGITFDSSGNYLAITSFQHDKREGGSMSFWRLNKTGTPTLTPVGKTIPMPRGVHLVELAK